MNKTEIKQIILEEIEAALEEMNMSPEMMAADSRPEEDDFAFDKMDGEMYDDAGDPMEAVNEAEDPLAKNLIKQYKIEISNNKKSNEEELNPAFRMGIKRLEKGNDPKKVNNAVAVAITKINSEPDTGGMAAAMMKAAKKMNEAEAVNEDLRGLMTQAEKMVAFANKQSGYEGGVSSPVRGVLAAMAAAGAPDFDGDDDLKAYWFRQLVKAIKTQKGRKYMSGFDRGSADSLPLNENIQQYIDKEDDISDIRGKKAGKDYKTIRIDFNKPMGGSLKGAVGSYARKKYGDNIELDWRDSQEVEIDINRDLNEMARTSNIFKLSQNANLKDVLQFMQRVNDVLKTYKSPGQKRPKKRFTPEEMKALATAMLKPEGFTSKDVIAATSYTSPAQANKFLAALEQKGLITITSVLKKSLTPDRDPNAPETRGRKAQSAEFDTADDPTGMDFSDFDNLDLSDPTSLYENKNNNNNNMSDNLTNYIKKVINEAKNPLAAKLKEVEAQGRIAALESKLAAIQEMIEETNNRLTRIDEDNEFSEMMDKKAVQEVRKQLKELERAEAKLQKEYDKVSGGRKKETVVDETAFDGFGGDSTPEEKEKLALLDDPIEEDAIDNAVDEVELEEDDLRFEGLNGVHDLKPMVNMNESLLRMQKLAGLITEGKYKKKN